MMTEFNIRNRSFPELIWGDKRTRTDFVTTYNRAWKLSLGGEYDEHGEWSNHLRFFTGALKIYASIDKKFEIASTSIVSPNGKSLDPPPPTLADSIMFDLILKRWIRVHGSVVPPMRAKSKTTKRRFVLDKS